VILTNWAIRHGVSAGALHELKMLVGVAPLPESSGAETPEQSVSKAVRLEAAKAGITLMRNNTGVAYDERGVPVRFGLANDSAKMNQVLKSHDLIGWTPVVVTPQMVGSKVAIFTSREVKRGGWRYTGTATELAQLKFAELVLADGGDAAFACGPGSFRR